MLPWFMFIALVIPSVYEEYRGYIVFAFFLFVCLSVNFFSA